MAIYDWQDTYNLVYQHYSKIWQTLELIKHALIFIRYYTTIIHYDVNGFYDCRDTYDL